MKSVVSALLLLLAALLPAAESVFSDDFSKSAPGKELPQNWLRYEAFGSDNFVEVASFHGKRELRLIDRSREKETGVKLFLDASPGQYYRARLRARRLPGSAPHKVMLQVNLLPQNTLFQLPLVPTSDKEYDDFELTIQAPAETRNLVLYLYSWVAETPEIGITDFSLEKSETAFPPPGAYAVRPRELFLNTELVREGRAQAEIAIPDDPAHRDAARIINAAVRERTGIELPVVPDTKYNAMRKLAVNLILPGHFGSNQAIAQLYRMHYTLLDARYPGRNGHVVRSLHNPFGDGFNVLFAGAGDDAGLKRAAEQLAQRILAQPSGASLRLGRLADIRLGDGLTPPENATTKTPLWETSIQYLDSGFFGHNIVSKNMMLYYMTGDEKYAREFMRLAFPTPEVAKEILKLDDERIHNPADPLVYPYHYTAIGMILYWDLIEESPFFSDADRARITQKFHDQLLAWRDMPGNLGVFVHNFEPRVSATDRHENWELLSVYGLARYFTKYYPESRLARDGARFTANALSSWSKGTGHEGGTLASHPTELDPVFLYAALTGDPAFPGSESMRDHARSLLLLANGSGRDWALNAASLTTLRRAAHLTGDQALADLADRIPIPQDGFRAGQSYCTGKAYSRNSLTELEGKWSSYRPKFIADKKWEPGFATDRVRDWISFRRGGKTGDFLLLDTKYEWGRNPFHNFNAVELILGGTPLLAGYHNQLHLYDDGVADAKLPKFSRFDGATRLGETAAVCGTVPDFNGHAWSRCWIVRDGQYVLALDRIVPLRDKTVTLAENYLEFHQAISAAPRGQNVLLLSNRMPEPSEAVLLENWRAFEPRVNGAPKIKLEGLNILLAHQLKRGDKITLDFDLPRDVPGARVLLELVNYENRGVISLALDGTTLIPSFHHNSDEVTVSTALLGPADLKAGRHTLTLEQQELPRGFSEAMIGLRTLAVVDGSYRVPAFTASCSAPSQLSLERVSVSFWSTASAGNAVKFAVSANAKRGEAITFGTALRPGTPLGDASESAGKGEYIAFRLPHDAVAIRQESGALLLEQNHLFAFHSTGADALFDSTVPVSLDWNLDTGALAVEAAAAGTLTLDGHRFALTPGVPQTQTLRPSTAFTANLAERLRTVGADCFASVAAEEKRVAAPAPELTPVWRADTHGFVSALELLPGGVTVAACGNTLEWFDQTGKKVREFKTAAQIGALHWWGAEGLLLAGCIDDKLYALTAQGAVKWIHTARMSAQLAAASQWYWHKGSIPGVTGLASSPWDNDKNRLFVGGTGTLEVLDRDGKLLHSYCQNWGAVNVFAFRTRPDGARELFTARSFCGAPRVYKINSVDPNFHDSSFRELPGKDDIHNYGWSMLGRTHLFVRDLDGSGRDLLIGDINGVFNHVIAWNLDGTVRYGAGLGEGAKAAPLNHRSYGRYMLAPLNVRGMAVENIDDTPTPEVIVASARKSVIIFDRELRKLRGIPLSSEPTVMAVIPASAARPGRIVVGTLDGMVELFDAAGVSRGQASLGAPITVLLCGGDTVTAAAANGQIASFRERR